MFDLARYFAVYNTLVILLVKICVCEEFVEVTVKQGVLQGRIENSFLKNNDYYAFRGIPFGEPPIGELRFKPPVEKRSWDGVLKVHDNKPTCMQCSSRTRNGEPYGVSGSEDCLYLSVYTPSLKESAPVVVFDFSDSFRTGFNGSDTYSPDFFIEEDVVVVTINHRLGMLGYLTTEDDVIPGNAGLKDFILGLEWIKNNIEHFGGDPNKVTLMGSKGGAALVNILLLSEKAKGLFARAIMQSGSAFEAIYFYDKPRSIAFKLGELVDVKCDDSQTLLEHLQKADAETLLLQESLLLDDTKMINYQMSIFPFSPTIENNDSNGVLTSLPEKGSIINDVPVLIGLNSREGLDLASHFIFEPRLIQESTQDFLVHLPLRPGFRFDRNTTIFKKAEEEIKEFYFEAGYFYYGNILQYAVYVGDILQGYALDNVAKKLAKELESPVYYYMFDFRGLLNENSEYLTRHARSSMENWGATNTDELCYLHLCSRVRRNYKELSKLFSEPAEFKVLKKMVRLWTNFIKTGNPTPENNELIKDFIWKPLEKDSEIRNYLHITKTLRMKEEPLGKRREFWDNFLRKYSEMAVDGLVQDQETLRDEL